MNINELNEWISTDEGKAWADGLKAPLLAKRDELLTSLREANGRVAQVASRATDAEKLLAEERAVVEKTVVDGELTRILKTQHVMEPCIPGVIQELKQAYGLSVVANGTGRTAQGMLRGDDGSEKPAGLEDIAKAWGLTDGAKEITLYSAGSGSGATGSGSGPSWSRTPAAPSLGGMSGRDLAKMSETEFQSALGDFRTARKVSELCL